MNLYLALISFLIISVFFLENFADSLNLTCLRGELPNEFLGTYDPKKYLESLKYQRDCLNYQIFSRRISVMLTLSFILFGGFEWTDRMARSLHWSSIPTGLVFVGILSALQMITSLPFSLYETFVLEEKYGFNKTTFKTFFLDLLKGILLGGILGGLVFSGIVYFFENAGPNAWIGCWIAFSLFQILLSYLAPAVIMPLFNKFQPLPETPLRKAIEDYAKTRSFVLSGIFTMDGSKRSTKSNAFFTGFGKLRRLVLFDTLIEKHTEQELVAVLAHEIGHFEKKHILKSMVLSVLVSGVLFYVFGLFLNNSKLFTAFQMTHVSVYASVVFIGIVLSPILRVLSLFTNKLSRMHEFEADAFAAKTYGKPEALISALKKLSVDSMSHLTPHPLKVALDYSHPPILERLKALRKINSET